VDSTHTQSDRPNGMRVIVYVLLGLVCVYQGIIVIRTEVGPYLLAGYRLFGSTAEERSERFVFGSGGGQFIDFLQAMVPDNAAVVLPERAGAFSQQNLMQFALLPRSIPICNCLDAGTDEAVQACRACYSAASHYLPAIGDSPPENLIGPGKRFVPFPQADDWLKGVWVPVDVVLPGEITESVRGPVLLLTGALDLLMMAAAAILGVMLVSTLTGWDSGWSLALGLPVGLGVLTVTVFVLGWIGGVVSLWVYAVAYAFWALALIGVRWWRSRRGSGPSPGGMVGEFQRSRGWLWLTPAGLLLAISTLVSVIRSYSTYDGIANWALKGYGIAFERSVQAGATWGGHGLAYPQNSALGIAFFRLLDGDIVPGSKLLQPLMFAAAILALGWSWRRRSVAPIQVGLAMLLLVSTPILLHHSTIGFANLAFAAYISLAVLAWSRAAEADGGIGYYLLAGVLFGLGAWTRPEGVGMGIGLMVILTLAAALAGHWDKGSLAAWLPFVAVAIAWLAFGWSNIQSDQAGRVMESLMDGVLHGRILTWPLASLAREFMAPFVDPSRWGLLPWSLLVMAVWGWLRADKRIGRTAGFSFLAAGASALAMLLLFYAAAYSSGSSSEYDVFLAVSFNRGMFPAWLLTANGVMLMLVSTPAESPRGQPVGQLD
jgi:hypothetical protein